MELYLAWVVIFLFVMLLVSIILLEVLTWSIVVGVLAGISVVKAIELLLNNYLW